MDGILSTLLNKYMSGQLANHPMMKTVNQMMAGKSLEEQRQTVINTAKSYGFDLNQLPQEMLRQAGLI
mgnify:CR=1 FL=1